MNVRIESPNNSGVMRKDLPPLTIFTHENSPFAAEFIALPPAHDSATYYCLSKYSNTLSHTYADAICYPKGRLVLE